MCLEPLKILMFPYQEGSECSQSEDFFVWIFHEVWKRIELDSNIWPATTKESNSLETRNTNKKEMLDSFLTFMRYTRSSNIISPNTIIEYSTYWGRHASKTGYVNCNWAGLQSDPCNMYGKGGMYAKGVKVWGMRQRQQVALDGKIWRYLEWLFDE